MADNTYHFSVVAGEVGTIISVDDKLRSGEIGYAFTRPLSEEDIENINRADRSGIRRRLASIHAWHRGKNVQTITQVVSIEEGLAQHEWRVQNEIKSTLRKLQTAIEQMGTLSKEEPHLNKFHLVSGDYTTNLQAALNNGSLRALINARCLQGTRKELRSILGSHYSRH